MPPASAVPEASVDAILSGSARDLRALLLSVLPKEGDTDASAFMAGLFWDAWCRHAALHEGFVAQLPPLRELLSKTEPAAWVASPAHPLWALLTLLRQAGAGYQPELGRAGDRILAEWATVVAPLATADWPLALQRAQAQWQQEQQKLARLEQRLIDGLRGQLRSRRAQQLAARELNRAMGGSQFSADMVGFLQDEWYGELQWCLLQFGESSPRWQQRVELTARLIDSLQDPGADAEARQRLYGLIAEIETELRSALMERAHDVQSVDQQLARIEREHVALLKGRPVPAAPFTLIANDDPWVSSAMSLSRDLLQRVTELAPGSEYLIRDGEAELRVRLVLKMEDNGQLLFVNRLGVKVLQKSFEEFAYWLAAEIARPLPVATDSPAVLRRLLQQLLARSAQQTRMQAELRQRLEADEQRRLAARDKALAEAHAIAEAQAQAVRAAEAKAREQELQRRRESGDAYRGDDSQRLRQARQIAAALAIGSWVEFFDEVGQSQRLRLAVQLASTGKLIFVDREGVRRADCERDVFAARLLDGSVRVLDQGPQFEDTLARVVDSLRRDRAHRE
jgi:hypothetical protein